MSNNRIKPQDIFLGILALLLISVSFYQTWLGLEQIFGHASIIISLALSLLLLFLCWLIRDAKLQGKSANQVMWIYIFIASFCFMANFNALYTRFMKTDIYSSELRSIKDDFNKLENETTNCIIKSLPGARGLKGQKVEAEKKQLMSQITSPGEPGIGTRALQIIRGLEETIGKKITILEPLNNDYTDLAIKMGRQIDDLAYPLTNEQANLKSDINSANLKWGAELEDVIEDKKKQIDISAQSKIDKSLNEYNKLGNRAKQVLGEDCLKFEDKKSDTQFIGKIGYAFEHAIKNFGIFQIVILMGCILLDFIIPIILILVTEKEVSSTSDGVWGGKNKSNTLI
jgi:hypothetical protein